MSLYGALAEATRQGKELLCEEVAVTDSATVDTPFQTVDAVVITQRSSAAPGVGSSNFTWEFASGVLTVYAWKPTSSADPTLIAGTVECTVSVVVIGRRRQ